MSYIGPLTNELLNATITEFKRKDNREKISKYIIDPIIYEISVRVTPYLLIAVLIQLVIIGLLVYISMNLPQSL